MSVFLNYLTYDLVVTYNMRYKYRRKNNILRIISRAQNGKLRKRPINCNSTKSIISVNNIYEYELLFAILMKQQKINNNKKKISFSA